MAPICLLTQMPTWRRGVGVQCEVTRQKAVAAWRQIARKQADNVPHAPLQAILVNKSTSCQTHLPTCAGWSSNFGALALLIV